MCGMVSNVSTVVFRSNLYPVRKDFRDDSVFRSKIHDPFSLEILKKQYFLTNLQELEYNRASVHCLYAAPKDYPWGTIRNANGQEQVVCRCLNTKCPHFRTCRPDFDPAELEVYKENQNAQPAIFEFEETLRKSQKAENGDAVSAAYLFEDNQPKYAHTDNLTVQMPVRTNPAQDLFVVHKPVPQVLQPEKIRAMDFGSFEEVSQDQIIEADPMERSVVNAGPGTGKTWTLIEKIVHMIREEKAEADNILVLCFSRAAVKVIRTRLSDAAESGRIGYEWCNVDIRTFDSFSTRMLRWVHENSEELLPQGFRLEALDYDQRIKIATSVFIQKKDILESYNHIIVDEVQDLVGVRAELVLAMLKGLPETCGFTLLGDSCQALYDYSATSSMTSEQFYQDVFRSFPNANYYTLTENYRQDGAFGQLTVPYRKAILSGDAKDRITAARDILNHISPTSVKLSRFSRNDALRYIGRGQTLGILARKNSQALQISAWLRNQDIPHSLCIRQDSQALGDWIARLLCNCENESMDESEFVEKHLALFPEAEYEIAKIRWLALTSTQSGKTRSRYEISDLLKGLLQNSKDPVLYESGDGSEHYAITVSNIHQAKGREFDTVMVMDGVIRSMADPDKENLQEHKVCYVALTRPKERIEKFELADWTISIENEDKSKRYAKAGGFNGAKKYLSHFEVGYDTDLDPESFAENKDRQQYIRASIDSGMRMKLIKCPEGTKDYIVYQLVPEDNEKIVLGYTSRSFARELEKAIQKIICISCPVYYRVYPHAFCDVYIQSVTSCVAVMRPVPAGAKLFGDVGVWSGLTITGFAAVDRDTY